MVSLYNVFKAVSIFIYILEYAVLIYCVLSWFRPNFKLFYTLAQFIQPFLTPFQKLSMKVMRYFNAPVDFTCLFAVLGFSLINRLWWMLYRIIALRL